MSAPFDTYSDNYDDVVQRSINFAGVRHDVFLRAKIRELAYIFARHFGSSRPSLLDVGCGVGAMHASLATITGRLAGCDLSSDCLAVARSRHADVEYREQHGTGLPFADAAFDATLAVCVFHHVPLEERDALLAEMARQTRPGGLVIVIEHNPLNPLTRFAVSRCALDHDAVLLSAAECRDRLRRIGLDEVRSRHILLAPSAERWAGMLEKPFHALPFGAQYVIHGEVRDVST